MKAQTKKQTSHQIKPVTKTHTHTGTDTTPPSQARAISPITIFITQLTPEQQSEIRAEVIVTLDKQGLLSPNEVESAMSGRLSDIQDLIDLRELILTKIS